MSTAEAEAFLARVAPFDLLSADELSRVLDALTPGQFKPGEAIVSRLATPSSLFVLAEGIVEEVDHTGPVALHAPGDSFDAVGLIVGRSEHTFTSRYRSTCYLLPAQLFHALTRSNAAFRDFFQRMLTRRMDSLVAVQQQREASSFLLAKLSERTLHPPVFAAAATTIKEATRLMQAHDATAVLVRDGDRVGIFTERDVRERHVLMGLSESTSIGGLASYDLHTLDREDFLFNALVLMTERAIRHVVVTRAGEIEGLFEQADLLGYLSNSSYVIADKVARATSIEQLGEASATIPSLIRTLHDRGVKTRYISRIVTELNRKLIRRMFERLAPADLQERCCLIVMGSEGRGEQLLRTDQDNGLILAREADETDDAAAAAFAQVFSAELAQLGYPPCEGGVMVTNPEWRQPLAGFQKSIRRWVAQPTGDAFLRLAILVDSAGVAGDNHLLGEIKAQLFELAGREEAFIGHFARATLSFPTPLGFFNRFVTERDGNRRLLDLKKGGIFAIVHGVRSLALEYRVSETNTVSRIQALSGRGPFGEDFTADLIEAFDFMSMLRLRQQFAALDRGEAYDNRVDVDHLTSFERNLLKDSLGIVNQFKTDVSHHYRLHML